jgi:hypothetical protein
LEDGIILGSFEKSLENGARTGAIVGLIDEFPRSCVTATDTTIAVRATAATAATEVAIDVNDEAPAVAAGPGFAPAIAPIPDDTWPAAFLAPSTAICANIGSL